MNGELEVVEQQAAPPMELTWIEKLGALAKNADQLAEDIKRIKTAALKLTNSADWVDFGGTPYLQGSGVEKIAGAFGIAWRKTQPLEQQEINGKIYYITTMLFSLGGRTIEAIGSRSPEDEFFDNQKILDEGDVIKASYTNCVVNGVTRILGIRNLTFVELEKAGLLREDMKGFKFKNKEKSPESQDLQSKVTELLKSTGANLAEISAFTPKDGNPVAGVTSVSKLSPGRLKVVYGKLQKLAGTDNNNKDHGKDFSQSTATHQKIRKNADRICELNPQYGVKWLSSLCQTYGGEGVTEVEQIHTAAKLVELLDAVQKQGKLLSDAQKRQEASSD